MSDAPKLFAKPRPGLKVPLPPTDPRAVTASPYLSPEGEEVEDGTWWQRLAQQGDVDLIEPKAPKNALVSVPAAKAEKASA